MRNSTIVFVFLGICSIFGIIFSVVILPRMDFGRNNIEVILELPINKSDLRYIQKGITPFCIEESNGIQLEAREGAPILNSADGIVNSIEGGRIDIKIDDIYVFVYPVKQINVTVGDYVTVGDILGYVDGNMLDFGLDNYKDSRYECPYLYMNTEGKDILTDGLKNSIDQRDKMCECSNIRY